MKKQMIIGTKDNFSESNIVKIAKSYGVIPNKPNKI